jgi:hypothetical protein
MRAKPVMLETLMRVYNAAPSLRLAMSWVACRDRER